MQATNYYQKSVISERIVTRNQIRNCKTQSLIITRQTKTTPAFRLSGGAQTGYHENRDGHSSGWYYLYNKTKKEAPADRRGKFSLCFRQPRIPFNLIKYDQSGARGDLHIFQRTVSKEGQGMISKVTLPEILLIFLEAQIL